MDKLFAGSLSEVHVKGVIDSQHLFYAKQLSVSIKVTYTFFHTALKKCWGFDQ